MPIAFLISLLSFFLLTTTAYFAKDRIVVVLYGYPYLSLMIAVFFRVNAVFRSFIAVVMGSFIVISMGAFTTMLRAIFCKCMICFQNYWHTD
jgi:hypothetical protein